MIIFNYKYEPFLLSRAFINFQNFSDVKTGPSNGLATTLTRTTPTDRCLHACGDAIGGATRCVHACACTSACFSMERGQASRSRLKKTRRLESRNPSVANISSEIRVNLLFVYSRLRKTYLLLAEIFKNITLVQDTFRVLSQIVGTTSMIVVDERFLHSSSRQNVMIMCAW